MLVKSPQLRQRGLPFQHLSQINAIKLTFNLNYIIPIAWGNCDSAELDASTISSVLSSVNLGATFPIEQSKFNKTMLFRRHCVPCGKLYCIVYFGYKCSLW